MKGQKKNERESTRGAVVEAKSPGRGHEPISSGSVPKVVSLGRARSRTDTPGNPKGDDNGSIAKGRSRAKEVDGEVRKDFRRSEKTVAWLFFALLQVVAFAVFSTALKDHRLEAWWILVYTTAVFALGQVVYKGLER